MKELLERNFGIGIVEAYPYGQGVKVVCKGEMEADKLVNMSGWVLNGNYVLKVAKIDMVMTADEICPFVTERVRDEEKLKNNFSADGEQGEKKSLAAGLVAALEKSFPPPQKKMQEAPKSPTHGKVSSNPQTPQRGRSPNRDRGFQRNNSFNGGGNRPQGTPFPPLPPPSSPLVQNPQFVPYPFPPYPPSAFYPQMSYLQAAQNMMPTIPMPQLPFAAPLPQMGIVPPPPPPPTSFGQKGGKGKGQASYGKGSSGGRGPSNHPHQQQPQQQARGYMGSRNGPTPWEGGCGFCFGKRPHNPNWYTCIYNPRSVAAKQAGGSGNPNPQGGSAPPTKV